METNAMREEINVAAKLSEERLRGVITGATEALETHGRLITFRSLRELRFYLNEIDDLLKRYTNHGELQSLREKVSAAILLEKAKRAAIALLLICVLGSAYVFFAPKASATITITEVPPRDPGGPGTHGTIAGMATGNPDDCVVVLYVRTDQWYVQPTADNPQTPIRDGRWQSGTHLGREYAALLVKKSYQPHPIVNSLPPLGGDVIAEDTKKGN